MSYRDDREALHNRVAQLEEQLKDARSQGQEQGRDEARTRAAQIEEKLMGMRGEIQMMEAELQAMRGASPPRPRNILLPVAAGLVAVGLGGVLMALRSTPDPPVVVIAPPEPPKAAVPTPQPPSTSASTPTVAPQAAPAETPPRSTTARWIARASRSEGLPIAPGTTCTIDAKIATNGATNAVVRDLEILCGTQKVYRSTDGFSGMADMSNDAREALGPTDDKSTFTLTYRDIGARTGDRAQVDLDTRARQGSVFRETIPRFRVELSISPSSTPGVPLSGPDQRLRRAGKVTEVSGVVPVKSGASCLLRAMPDGKGEDCIAEVTCGASVLWPQTAPVNCTYDGSRPNGVGTAGGEASSLLLEGTTLTLKTKALGATIVLEEP
jgi:hypothetical protein